MIKDFEGCDICIKHIRVLEIVLPRLINYFHYGVLAGCIVRFLEGTVISLGFMFSLGLVKFSSRRVLVNCVIVECNYWWD